MVNPEDKSQPTAGVYQTGGWKAHWILIVCSLVYMLNYMDRVVLTVVLQPMKLEMALSDTQLGALQMVYMLCHGICALPIAYLIDRWSRKKTVGILALAWSVFTACTGMAWNFMTAVLPRAVTGIGASGLATGGVSMITAAYPKSKHGTVMGIFHIAIPLGIGLGAITGGVMAAKFGWRSPFFLLSITGLVLAIAAFFLKDYRTVRDGVAPGLKAFSQSVIRLIKIPTLRWFLPGYGLLLISSMAQINWLPTFVMRQFGWGTEQAGYLMCAVSLTAIIGALVGGVLADRWYRKNHRSRLWLPAIAALLTSLCLAASFFAFSYSFALGLAISLLFGIVNMIAIPSLSAVSQDVVPPAQKGLSYGLTTFCMYLFGGAWSPLAVGVISDSLGGGAEGLMRAVVLASVGGLLACLCFIMGARQYIQDEDKVRGAVIEAG